MTALWWRSWHGAPTDSKWLAIAKKANVAPGIVSAVAWALFDYASQQHEARGCVEGFDCESYAAFSGFDQETVERAYDAICTKLAEGGKLTSWETRQPKREDVSTERVQRFRERNATKRNVTRGNAILDKIRLDNKVVPLRGKESGNSRKTGIPDHWQPSTDSTQKAQKLGLKPAEIGREAEKFRNHARQNDRKCVRWDAAFDNWCIKAAEFLNRSPPSDGKQFPAMPGTAEFLAWKSYLRDRNNSLVRILNQRELEGRAFNFEAQWPPGHQGEAS